MCMLEYITTLMYIISLFTFCFTHKHLLMTLLSMEMLMLVMFLLFFMYIINYNCGMYFVVVFLTFAVSKSSLGLAILVSLIRCLGNNMTMSLSTLSW